MAIFSGRKDGAIPAAALSFSCLLLAGAGLLPAEPASRGFEFRGAGNLQFPEATEPPAGLDLFDFNQDGMPDALVSFDGTAPLLRTYRGVNPLTFEAHAAVEAPFAGEVRFVEITGDDRPDALIFRGGSEAAVAIFNGAEGGVFLRRSVFSAGNNYFLRQLQVIDLDGDGFLDLVVAADHPFVAYGPEHSRAEFLSVSQHTCTGMRVFHADPDDRLDLLFSVANQGYEFVLLRLVGQRIFQTNQVSGGGQGPLEASDVDGDGRVETLAVTRDGLVAFTLVRPLANWEAQARLILKGEFQDLGRLLVDFDGDGVRDYFRVSGEGRVDVYYGSRGPEGLSFGSPLRTELPAFCSWDPRIREVNGDGLPDILLGSCFFLGDGRRMLRAATWVGPNHSGSTEAGALDVNQDGFQDLLRLHEGYLEVLLGGRSGFSAALRSADDPFPWGGRRGFVAGRLRAGGPPLAMFDDGNGLLAVEIGSDGKPGSATVIPVHFVTPGGLEIASWYGEPRLLAVRRLPGESTRLSVLNLEGAEPIEDLRLLVPDDSAFPRAADLDGDGFTDLVLAAPGGVQVFRGGPGGPVPYRATAALPLTRVRAMAAVDVEGEGLSELAVVGGDSVAAARLVRRSPTGPWTSSELVTIGANSIAAADLDGDGHTDVAAGNRQGFEIYWNDGGSLRTVPQRISCQGSDLDRGGLELADLDGDGRLDLVAGNYSGLSVIFGDTPRHFGGTIRLLTLQGGGLFVPADFNGDGTTDVLVNYEFGNDAILFGKPEGGLDDPAPIGGPTSAFHSWAYAGDFTGDGRIDLMTMPLTLDQLRLIPGRGDGSFDAPVPLPGGTVREAVAAGLLDGDSWPDLVTNLYPFKILLFLGGPEIATRDPSVLLTGFEARVGSIVDLNGDGRRDLVLDGFDQGRIDLQQALAGRGDGTFEEAVKVDFPSVRYLSDLLTDFNGDRIPDTVLVRQSKLISAFGRGDFAFTESETVEMGVSFMVRALEDFDGDAIADLLGVRSGSDNLFVMKGTGGGRFSDPQLLSSTRVLLLLDVNHDGLRDILVTIAQAGFGADLEAFLTSRGTLFDGLRTYAQWGLECLTAGDFNLDGRAELATCRSGGADLEILAGAPDRQLEVKARLKALAPGGSNDSSSLAAADVDGDRAVDLAILRVLAGSVSWFRGNGDFSFAAERKLLDGAQGTFLHFPDLDGDGLDDALISGFSTARNLGEGTFSPLVTHASAGRGLPTVRADFNADGIPDVAQAVGISGASIAFHGGLPDGRFEGLEVLSAESGSPGGLVVADFNGDRLLDVAYGVRTEGRSVPTQVWYLQRDGSLRPGPQLLDRLNANGGGVGGLAAVDLNGDGAHDLLSAYTSGYVSIHFGGSEGLDPAGVFTHGSRSPDYLLMGNFAGDASLDMVTAGESGFFLTIGDRTSIAFRRGDPTADGRMDLNDPIMVLGWLFLGGPSLACDDGADLNDDGRLDIGDAMQSLNFLFLGGPPPSEPFGRCGPDPSADRLRCETVTLCGP